MTQKTKIPIFEKVHHYQNIPPRCPFRVFFHQLTVSQIDQCWTAKSIQLPRCLATIGAASAPTATPPTARCCCKIAFPSLSGPTTRTLSQIAPTQRSTPCCPKQQRNGQLAYRSAHRFLWSRNAQLRHTRLCDQPARHDPLHKFLAFRHPPQWMRFDSPCSINGNRFPLTPCSPSRSTVYLICRVVLSEVTIGLA